MADIRAAISLIAGVEPTPAQVQRVQAIAHSLDIGPTDAMLPILIALDTYHAAFTDMPAACERAAHAAAISAQHRAAAASTDVVMGAINRMAPAFADTLDKIAIDVAGKDKWQWVAICAATAFTVLALTAWVAHQSGYETGRANGYWQAQQQSRK